ncbi:MAG: FAD-dependent oxidoreductase [Thermomicrobiales bacterium]|nr:FAD-dependent oxidoreductase [Thermomicrobiales bacterium]
MIVELANPSQAIDEIPIAAFSKTLTGTVIRPTDDEYDAARSIWNARHDRRPALIVRPLSAADVQASVRFAAEQGLRLSVKNGGHGVTGAAVAHNGLMIDLSAMKRIEIDPEARIAVADPGLTWGEYAMP